MLCLILQKKDYLIFHQIKFLNSSSQEINYNLNKKVDVITAIQVHHYLHNEERKLATKSIYNSLNYYY